MMERKWEKRYKKFAISRWGEEYIDTIPYIEWHDFLKREIRKAVNEYIDYEHSMTNISLWICPKCKLRHLASNYICSCGFRR